MHVRGDARHATGRGGTVRKLTGGLLSDDTRNRVDLRVCVIYPTKDRKGGRGPVWGHLGTKQDRETEQDLGEDRPGERTFDL